MDISYEVIYSKRKTVSLIVERDRSVIVRAPFGTSNEEIEKLIDSRKVWLYEKVNHPQKYPTPPIRKEFVNGESLLYKGRNYRLEISDEEFTGVRFSSKFIVSNSQKQNIATVIRKWYIDRAKMILIPIISLYANKLGVGYKEILVSDLKYTWASCSENGTLNFNWRIIKAPLNVINYLIIHELAHLIEHNHTASFWNIVAVQLPEYKQARNWLKEKGYQLEVDFL